MPQGTSTRSKNFTPLSDGACPVRLLGITIGESQPTTAEAAPMQMDNTVGKDFELGLANLKKLTEK